MLNSLTSNEYKSITLNCAVPENIQIYSPNPPLTEEIGISWGMGGSARPKNVKKCMTLNLNFQGVGSVGYFLELHILSPKGVDHGS